LRQRFGGEGVAAWWELLEVLARSENHCFDAREELDWFDLLTRLHLDEETAKEFLDLLARLGKIDAELWSAKIIWSEPFLDNIRHIYTVSRKRPAPEKPVFLLPNSANLLISPGEMRQSRGEQSRAEKSRVKEQIEQIGTVHSTGENGKHSESLLDLPFENTFDLLLFFLAEFERSKRKTAPRQRLIKAQGLCEKYSPQHIFEKARHFKWVMVFRRELAGKNPAGYFVKSIEESWPPPAGYEEWREQELKRRRGRDFRIDD